MTDLELLQLDAIDRAERKLREIGTHPSLTVTEKWRRLLEAIRDDAFADFEDLVGGDLSFDAYWDDETGGVDQPLGPGGGPVWWPLLIYNIPRPPQDHSFWQGEYPFSGDPKTSKKRKRKAWTSHPPMHVHGPQDRPSPAKIAASPKRESLTIEAIQRDDEQVLELLLLGAL